MTPSDYSGMFDSAIIDPKKEVELDNICKLISLNIEAYKFVSLETSIPWILIASIHYRESDQSFQKHLHNGDPLTAKTVHVPRNRPVEGEPPFRWQDSAVDALTGFWKPKLWNMSGCLEFLERYNGLGYRTHSVNSPYLWDWTQHYTSGLFVEDGKFDPNKKENRAGCVAIIKTLEMKGLPLIIEDNNGAPSNVA